MGRGDEETSDGWQISGSRISGKYYEMTIGQRGTSPSPWSEVGPFSLGLLQNIPPVRGSECEMIPRLGQISRGSLGKQSKFVWPKRKT